VTLVVTVRADAGWPRPARRVAELVLRRSARAASLAWLADCQRRIGARCATARRARAAAPRARAATRSAWAPACGALRSLVHAVQALLDAGASLAAWMLAREDRRSAVHALRAFPHAGMRCWHAGGRWPLAHLTHSFPHVHARRAVSTAMRRQRGCGEGQVASLLAAAPAPMRTRRSGVSTYSDGHSCARSPKPPPSRDGLAWVKTQHLVLPSAHHGPAL